MAAKLARRVYKTINSRASRVRWRKKGEGGGERERKRKREGEKERARKREREDEHMSVSPASLLAGSRNLCRPVNHVKIWFVDGFYSGKLLRALCTNSALYTPPAALSRTFPLCRSRNVSEYRKTHRGPRIWRCDLEMRKPINGAM